MNNMNPSQSVQTVSPLERIITHCRSKVKQTALEIAAAIRPANKFNRVGISFVERIEAKIRSAIREKVRIHPSRGKTLL